MQINHFLIVFDLNDESLVSFDEFGGDIGAATAAYAAKEAEYQDGGGRFEIVLVGADSRETLEVTHSRYFKPGQALPF